MPTDCHIEILFNDCRAIKGLLDVQHLAHFLAERGFLPAVGPAHRLSVAEDIDARVVASQSIDASWDERKPFEWWQQGYGYSMIISGHETLVSSLHCALFGPEHAEMEIGALVPSGVSQQAMYAEKFAQGLRLVSLELYDFLHAVHGCINGSSHKMHMTAVSQLELLSIAWANFFGPEYVEKYGKDFFLQMPGFHTEILSDGGVFHQLAPNFVTPTRQAAEELRKQIITYCASHGYKVTCNAPYFMAATPTNIPQTVSDAELQDYLQHTLGMTLLLKDGTRVKAISIPWDILSSRQRHIVLQAIKQSAIDEIRRPGREGILFEFNEIPEELEQMLADLAGDENPDFKWSLTIPTPSS